MADAASKGAAGTGVVAGPGIRVGVTGHRQPPKLPDECLAEVHSTVRRLLEHIFRLVDDVTGNAGFGGSAQGANVIVSSLARGADQIVAEEGLACGATLDAILPFPAIEYRRDFDSPETLGRFNRLLAQASTTRELDFSRQTSTQAYECAGVAMLETSDLLIAIWDECEADGRGGTAHVVERAVEDDIPVLLINPGAPEEVVLKWPGPGAPSGARARIEDLKPYDPDKYLGALVSVISSTTRETAGSSNRPAGNTISSAALQEAPLHSEIAEGPVDGRAYWITTVDGRRIRIGVWRGAGSGTVCLFPGRSEYVEKYGRVAVKLTAHGFSVITVDWRGQGLADRHPKVGRLGHVGDFSEFQHDVDALIAAADALDLPGPKFLLAHSMGGCIGLRTLHRMDLFERTVFSAPMWGLSLSGVAGFAARPLAFVAHVSGFAHLRAPGTSRESYIEVADLADNVLTTDPKMAAFMRRQIREEPALGLAGPTLGWTRAALRETRALASMPPPEHAALTVFGSDETVVDPTAIRAIMAGWRRGTLVVEEGARHEIMMETQARRDAFLERAVVFYQTGK